MTVQRIGRAGPPALVEAGRLRPAWAEVDLDAIRHNASVLAGLAAPARLCAVVKAAGYGHGAVPVAAAALEGGATHLAVALVEEGRQLREGGIDAPVLVLSQPAPEAMPEAVAAELTPTVYTAAGIDALASAARASGRTSAARPGAVPTPRGPRVPGGPVPVQIKVDTGMHRVGAAPEEVLDLVRRIAARPELALEGIFTHLAVADEVDDPYTAGQLARFEQVLADLASAGVRPDLVHAANSAGTLFHARSHYDLVRCGIALYGLAPAAEQLQHPDVGRLRPAMSLKARVSHVKTLEAGERLSYGLRYRLERRSVVATVPLGYADGVTRSLSARGGEVLIGGRRCRLAGTVTMDQVLVDCGPDADVVPGDEVVLVGSQGGETLTAWDWAQRVGTVAYEVVCGVSVRVPRTYAGPAGAAGMDAGPVGAAGMDAGPVGAARVDAGPVGAAGMDPGTVGDVAWHPAAP